MHRKAKPSGPTPRGESEVELRVRRGLESSGWTVRQGSSKRPVDLLATKRAAKYAIEIKAVREGRHELVEARFADAVLRLRADLRPGERGLVFLLLDRASSRVVARLVEYATRFAAETDWVLLGAEGVVATHGNGLEELSDAFASERSDRGIRESRFDLFSDLNQWLLKVLLAPALPRAVIAAPLEPPRNARHLAKLASVSEPTTSRLLANLREGGWLVEDARNLKLRRAAELLERWRAARARPDREIGARFLFPPPDPLKDLQSRLNPWPAERFEARSSAPEAPYPNAVLWSASPRACFALFAALKFMKRGFVHGAPVHVYVEKLDEHLLDRLRLRRSGAGEAADVSLREPRTPQSVFRAAVGGIGPPCADILQCWLDVSHHPVRGEEQARELLQYMKSTMDAYETWPKPAI
jgi:hypothetical protein